MSLLTVMASLFTSSIRLSEDNIMVISTAGTTVS